MIPLRRIIALSVLVAALVIGGYTAYQMQSRSGFNLGQGKALVGGPFELTAHDGRRISDKDLRGKYLLVVFGYTYCPDVCPGELQVISAALDRLGPDAAKIQPVLITIDPQRDTPQQLAEYVTNFRPGLIGLTGTPQEIATVAKEFRVYYAKAGDASGDDYLMDHSSIIYLMGPDGAFVRHFTYGTDPQKLAEELKSVLST